MSKRTHQKKWIIAISGASGIVYGHRLVEVLVANKISAHLVMTNAARIVIREEMGIQTESMKSGRSVIERLWGKQAVRMIEWHDNKNLASSISSGSFPVEGMMVVPCSMSSVSGILHGRSNDLLTRAADVTLKEARPLIVVPREMPMSTVHLRNLYELATMGVRVMPAAPGFYQRPTQVSQLVDFVVNRVLDHTGLELSLVNRWKS